MLCVAVAWSSDQSSGGVAICYLLPVLWMTSCFMRTIVSMVGPVCRSKRRERNSLDYYINTTKFCSTIRTISKCTSWVAHWGWNLLSTISLFT